MLAYHVPSNLGVGKHEKEEVHGYCGKRTAAGGAGPTGKERHKGSFRWILRRHVRHLVAHRALPYSRWSHHGNRGHVPLLPAHKCRTTEPLAGHPPHHRDRSPGHLALGPCDHLHKRALPLLVIGAILIIVGAAWGPETRDVDFSEDVQEAGAAGRPKPPPERRQEPTARPVALRPGVQGGPSRPERFLSQIVRAPV